MRLFCTIIFLGLAIIYACDSKEKRISYEAYLLSDGDSLPVFIPKPWLNFDKVDSIFNAMENLGGII